MAEEVKSPKTWLESYFDFAKLAAERSKDSTQVGAIMVTPEGVITMPTYNGPPKGVLDLKERFERPMKYLFASHAEQNLIAFCARVGMRTAGSTIVTTHAPCAACSRLIIQAGFAKVICVAGPLVGEQWIAEQAAARVMFAEAGIEVYEVDPDAGTINGEIPS